MSVQLLTDADPAFWPLMGPVFASEAVYRERHSYPMFHDVFTTWAVLADGARAIGWVAIIPSGGGAKLRFLHVRSDVPDAARHYDALITAALEQCGHTAIITAHEQLAPTLARHGFAESRRRGAWVTMCVGHDGGAS